MTLSLNLHFRYSRINFHPLSAMEANEGGVSSFLVPAATEPPVNILSITRVASSNQKVSVAWARQVLCTLQEV